MDIIGSIFNTKINGKLEVIRSCDNGLFLVRFLDTGYESKVQKRQIQDGKVKDRLKPSVHGVGFIGCGAYKSKIDNVITRPYNVWKGILERCYGKRRDKFKAYDDVEVCKEWHNYQNFAKWYYENYPDDGIRTDIDKDIKSGFKKIYSPETCIFLSGSENNAFSKAKEWEFISPTGDAVKIYNLGDFCLKNNLDRGHMCKVNSGKRRSHKGWKSAISN